MKFIQELITKRVQTLTKTIHFAFWEEGDWPKKENFKKLPNESKNISRLCRSPWNIREKKTKLCIKYYLTSTKKSKVFFFCGRVEVTPVPINGYSNFCRFCVLSCKISFDFFFDLFSEQRFEIKIWKVSTRNCQKFELGKTESEALRVKKRTVNNCYREILANDRTLYFGAKIFFFQTF